MIGKVFKLFREKGGLLKALDLWDWYESLDPQKQKMVKYYFSLKTIKNLRFPYKAKHFDSGDIKDTPYTKRTFLGSIAQMALLEGDTKNAEWLYLEALKMEGTPIEAHMILNDLVILAQKEKNYEKMETYAKADIELFEKYKESLKEKEGGSLPHLNSFDLMLYLLERKGEYVKALKLLSYMESQSIPVYPETKERLKAKCQNS
ncbi:hypothetical protein [Hydrogenobacter hydrogenophilus]|uniref:Tetratricopeptide repeat-containing protein n=1 Tax=Hydrogenobacter hydrogenophilus TaxID=35835 RepID=A0A285P3L4_9AQUI|nr:hypothetical protein [Hydrogenobacter hydrogenophilus]SNZ16048.1 hypothetical protein SAMN06265353_1507 [Hydrogenobacter hydrogenophilus]